MASLNKPHKLTRNVYISYFMLFTTRIQEMNMLSHMHQKTVNINQLYHSQYLVSVSVASKFHHLKLPSI